MATQTPTSPSRPSREWLHDRRIQAWAFYDFAIAPFAILVATVTYSTYFKEVVVSGARNGDFLWGLAGSLSIGVVALTAPVLGVFADVHAAKRPLLLAYTSLIVLGTLLLGTVTRGMVWQGMAFFMLANIGFQGGQVFYNAFLPELAPPRDLGVVSGLAFAAGYAGGLISLAAALPYYIHATGADQGPNGMEQVRYLFFVVAVGTALLSVPTFLEVRDRPRPALADGTTASRPHVSIGDTFRRLWNTLRRLRHYTTAFRFLLAYLVYMDAITTMTVFVAIYARDTGGLDLTHILGLFLISQLTAIPGALVLGRLADRIGSKTTLSLCLVLWTVILVLAGLARNWPMFIAVGLLSGIGIGSLQSVSRTMMSQVSPPEQQAEFFGFYAVAGRASAIVGPVLFGAISSLTGNQRLSIVALIVMIAGAFVLLQRVHDDGTSLPGAFGPATPRPVRP